jgi:predicted nucleotidyltransferase
VKDPLQTTLADAAEFLASEGIAYALIGGMAASLRGETRTTADVDLVIDADVSHALNLITRLEQSSFRPLFDKVAEVVERSFILPLRHRTTNIKVDMSLGLSGFEQKLIGRAELLDIAGTMVSVVTSEDLLVMKILAGRPQDTQDARGIVAAQSDRLDWEYCLNVARELGEALNQDLVSPIQSLRNNESQ